LGDDQQSKDGMRAQGLGWRFGKALGALDSPVALARKLSIVMFAMWKRGESFVPYPSVAKP
jgi:hypothetical protein